MKTFVDSLCAVAFVIGLLLLDAWMDENKQRIEQARLSGVTEGAKAVALKCGSVSGFINVKEQK